jgi:ATP-dependent DNA ligase
MLCKSADTVPVGDGWRYEPKWDGFRCIVFRDGPEVGLTSRNERPFTRYFPELLGPLAAALADRCVVDGEIVVPDRTDAGLDFDALLQRIHPAESRVRRLAGETPAAFVAFDLLALGDRSLLDVSLSERVALLAEAVRPDGASVFVTPSTTDAAVAEEWFGRFEGAGLDGIVAKRLDGLYTPDKRTLVKVKHRRTAECVVAGYRVHKDGRGVGSLLLGLYDEVGRLHHVGVAASFAASFRTALLVELAPLLEGAVEGHPWQEWAEWQHRVSGQLPVSDQRVPGGGSRWNAGKDLSWVPVRADRVAEVTFGQLQSGRFRHGVSFVRWRPDRTPSSCTYGQLDVVAAVPFESLFD